MGMDEQHVNVTVDESQQDQGEPMAVTAAAPVVPPDELAAALEQIQQVTPTSPDYQAVRDEAVKALLPVVNELDESPERQFEILMTAVRTGAGDAQLLGKALHAALQISSTTTKAEALIDIVNEASYQIDNQ
jgi:Zn-dependent oligopeptidase